MSKYKLRPYQEEAVEKGIWAANSFENNSLLVLPTAAGKSLIVSGIAEKLDKEVLVLQPSREILEQNAYKMSMYVDEDEIGVYSASFKRKDIRKYTFATIQSVYKVPELFKDFGFLIVDESDLINPKNQKGMFTSFIKAIGSPPMIGLTATPFRNVNGMSYNDDGQLISGTTLKLVNRMNPRMWNRIAYNIGYKELTEQGYLSEMLYSSRTIIDPKSIPVNASRSDYNLEEYTKMLTPYEQNILETISEAKKHRKHILVFCSSVSQAKRMASATKGAGWVSGDMSINDRNDTITKFRNGEIQVVFNCSVLTVGFDFPSLDCIFLLRPTKSLRLYMQMVGRGLRLAEGKTNCVVIDYTGTYDKFGDLNKIKLDKNEKGLWELYANGKPQHGKVLFEWAIDTAPKSSIII